MQTVREWWKANAPKDRKAAKELGVAIFWKAVAQAKIEWPQLKKDAARIYKALTGTPSFMQDPDGAIAKERKSLKERQRLQTRQRFFKSENSFMMDLLFDSDGKPAFILIWVFFFWLLIPYYIFKWSYLHIYVPRDDAKRRELAAANTVETWKKEGDKLYKLSKQLREIAPKTPPERMRATIAVNGLEVNMLLELTQAETAIIDTYHLRGVELDNEAMFTKEQLSHAAYEHERRLNDINEVSQPIHKAITAQTQNEALERMKTERRVTTVADLMAVPFVREFSSTHEAKEYSDRLKSDFLPRVRKLIDEYGQHRPVQTLEF